MFKESNIIKNRILEAFLNAVQEVIDIDGKNSILEHSNLNHLKEKLPAEGYTSIHNFIKLIESMNYLLVHSDLCIYEIGRKFSFYLSPFGLSVSDFIELLNDLGNLVSITLETEESGIYKFNLTSCQFCKGNQKNHQKDCTEDIVCVFFEGFLSEFIKKNSQQKIQMEIFQNCVPNESCIFKFSVKDM